MRTIDYNGSGRWSCDEIQRRYVQYAAELKVSPRDMTPVVHRDHHGDERVYPLMHKVIEGIEAGDRACIAIGVEFIEEDEGFPFGRAFKSNTARALRRAARRCELTGAQAQRIRKRVLSMLHDGRTPREYKDYAKLLSAAGFTREDLLTARQGLDHTNPYVMRYYRYFEMVLGRQRTQ